MELIVYHKIQSFNDPETELLNTLWEKEKMLELLLSPFSTMFSTQSKTEIMILATLNLLSANAFSWFKAPVFVL